MNAVNAKISMPYEDVFELIEWYRIRPPLWNGNGNSNDRLGKKEYKASITDLVISFQSRGKFYTAELLREKFANLKKIFNREWRRVLASVADNSGKIYTPRWIYYDRLLFLRDAFTYSAETQSLLDTLSSREIEKEQQQSQQEDFNCLQMCTATDDGNVSPIPSIALSVSSPEISDVASNSSMSGEGADANGLGKNSELQLNGESRTAKRRKKSDDKWKDLMLFLKDWKHQGKRQRRDEVDSFTDYIGNKLRRLPEGVRAHVEMEIHQIIYQAVTNHANL